MGTIPTYLSQAEANSLDGWLADMPKHEEVSVYKYASKYFILKSMNKLGVAHFTALSKQGNDSMGTK